MKKKIENILIYVECLIKNMFTLSAVCYSFLAIYWLISGHIIDFIICMIVSMATLYLFNWGIPSYYACKRYTEHLIEYKSFAHVEGYCAGIGYAVALRRFKDKYPAEYKAMVENAKAMEKKVHMRIVALFNELNNQ